MKRRQFIKTPVAYRIVWGGRVGARIKVRCLATRQAKVRYPTEAAASRALARQQRRVAQGDFKRRCVRYYRCEGCGGYHLTGVPLQQFLAAQERRAA